MRVPVGYVLMVRAFSLFAGYGGEPVIVSGGNSIIRYGRPVAIIEAKVAYESALVSGESPG